VAEFLHKAHQVSKRSWQAKRLGIRITNDPAHRKRLEVLASLGALRSYLLEHEGDPLAFVLGIQWKGCFLFEETGYHSGYKKWSPGTVLLFRLLEDLTVRDTPRLVDFGFGDAQYKRSFANRETLSGPVLLVPRSLRPMAVMWLNRVRQMVSQRMRAVTKSLSLASVLRQLYRR
jgi:CelD/BcsL family acetyltransferase involved in cellulose biosynthesis